MKLKLKENIKQSLERLKKRTQKPSFNNNKGLTKIQRFIILDTIEFIENLGSGESIDELEDK
jgi:hypothetical protein